MRTLTDHIVDGDSVNHQLQIQVLDGPGAGGASHFYCILGHELENNPALPLDEHDDAGLLTQTNIVFQNGPIKEAGVNGITHEALLAIVIDRLRSFQAGPYACDDNEQALMAGQSMMFFFQKRTRERIARNVEGTHEK